MSEVVDFDKWKKENPRQVKRRENYRQPAKGASEAIDLELRKADKKHAESAREDAEASAMEHVAIRILNIAKVESDWRSPITNIKRWKTRYMLNTSDELWSMLAQQFGNLTAVEINNLVQSEPANIESFVKDNPIHYGVAAQVYLEKTKAATLPKVKPTRPLHRPLKSQPDNDNALNEPRPAS